MMSKLTRRLWFDGKIMGQEEIDNMVRELEDAEPGVTIATGDTLVVRNEGHTTVYTERFTAWDRDPFPNEEVL